MLRIAIVDDDKDDIASCRNCIERLSLNALEAIDSYESGETFLNSVMLNEETYDIVILDIDMPELSGFDIAGKLNEIEYGAIILFYTAHQQYVFQSFAYQPFRYIRKECTNEELPFAIKHAMMKLKSQEKKTITIQNESKAHIIETSKIEMLACHKNYIEIYDAKGVCYKTRSTMSEMIANLPDKEFVYINKGVVINLKYVKTITPEQVVLKSNKMLSLSRRKYADVRKKFYAYVGGQV